MKNRSLGCFALVMSLIAANSASAEQLLNRINLGTNPGHFFENFVPGGTSHTNTLCFDDGAGQACYNLTIEGFDAGGSPAVLVPNAQAIAVGIDGFVDPGESLKYTINSIAYSVIGLPMGGGVVDPASFMTTLNIIDFAAFDDGDDTYTYSGVGEGGISGDDTRQLTVAAPVMDGDMFTVTGDSGQFRMLFLSLDTCYDVVPEPNTGLLSMMGLLGLVGRCRRTV